MPRTIIAPSVLASDFGQLTAECERMIKGGAEWLHMGISPLSAPPLELIAPQMSWMGDLHLPHFCLQLTLHPATLCPTSPWVRFRPNSPPLSLTLSRRTRPFLRVEEHSRHIHGLPYDGRST
jgi:hypothetical protein